MFIKQISVFLENAKGGLSKLTRVIAGAGIDLIALSIADTQHYGIMRFIVSDAEGAMRAIKGAGYAARLTDVIAVSVSNRPGGLSEVLALLDDAGISVEYLYSFARSAGERAQIILRVNDDNGAAKILGEAGVQMLDQRQVDAL